MADYQVDFRALKSKVGVDDIAYALGYRLDKSAGVGRYIEMVRSNQSGEAQDTIVIKNPRDKAEQTFFRRNGAQGGDVISLIKEHINSFNVSGRNEWDVVVKVLARFANEPLPEYGNSEYLYKSGYSDNREFDINRYSVASVENNMAQAMMFFERRGISADTVRTFAPHLCLVSDRQSPYHYCNLGFPYKEPGTDNIVGFEIRGIGGFKGKASGTNSTTGAWIADLSKDRNPFSVSNVYFAESGYDIMAFYQANKVRIDKESSAFVSIGGTFSDRQITGIMSHYADSRAVDCFDNDLPGRVYGIRMAGLLENIPMKFIKEGNCLRINIGGKSLLFDEDKVCLKELGKAVSLRYKTGQWKAPVNFKDWNDVVMNKPLTVVETKTKFQRNERLEQARGIKL